MSRHEIQLHEDQPLDAIDELIRWALVDEVAGEEPSPQVWHNIQAQVMVHSRPKSNRSQARTPWQQFASILQACAWGFVAPVLETNWDYRLAPQERSYLVWRQILLLSFVPVSAMKIC